MIVLAAGGDPGRLRVTLSSVRDQPSPQLEILVVGLDGGLDEARDAAADDTRARFVTASGVEQARTLGLSRSRGDHVLFAAPGDVYPAGAIADLLTVLAPGETLLLSAGPDDVEPADLLTRPDAARHPVLGRLVLPRDVAVAAVAQAGTADPDGLPVALVALARGFTPTPYAAWTDDRGTKPRLFTVRHDPLPLLPARIAADQASLDLVTGPAREQRALGALDALRPFLESAEGADPATWSILVAHASELVAVASDQLESLDVATRVLAHLGAQGRREEVERFASVITDRRSGEDMATRVVGGRVLADLDVALPESALVVGEHQSALVAQARRLTVEDDVLTLEVFLGVRHVDQIGPAQVEARLVDGDRSLPLQVRTGTDPAVTRWMDETEHDHDAGLVVLRIGVRDLLAGAWQIELDWADGDLRRTGLVTQVAGSGSASRRPLPVTPVLAARLRERHGRVALHVTESTPPESEHTVSRIELLGNELRLTVDPSIDRVALVGGGTRVEARAGTAGFWSIPLEAERWDVGLRPLPTGSYRLRFDAAGAKVPVTTSAALMDRLPEELRSELYRIQLLASGDGVVVRVDPPLADDELGIRGRWRQRSAYLQITAPLDPDLVYFQSFAGAGVGDHPGAILAELVRRRPDLDVRWMVADSSVPAPPGATPVLLRSREWYDVLARASHLVINVEMERWFTRRAGQQILQTFHGYPSKAMGLGLWRPRGLLPSQIEQQLDQTSRTWNNLLTPAPEMDQYYRRDYDYKGRILALGYPRNDVLVGPEAASIRTTVRERLGISAHQRAVLYAPTWRDDLATNYRVAEAVHYLDVEQAAAGLGDDWVVLLRGHRFHAAAGSRGSRVIDVTAYPEINDLILACDAAVLDYSSLRFDVALVNRPMVFLVPDLEDYTLRTRGFLWDYRETAPGPLVSTTAEVVAQLRDLEAVRARWSGDLATFNERYNRLQDGHAAERVVEEFFRDLLT